MTSHAPHGGDDMVHDRELDEMVGLSAPESGAQAGASTQAPRHVLKDLRYDEEPCKWPASRIIVSNSAKIPLPLDLETRRFSPFRSVATPACVNLATIKMPLTAKEILLFFPQHINNHDLQDRFYQNKIKAATQAVVINWSRDLQIPDLVRSNRIDGVVMQRRRQGAYDLDTPCTNYFVSHYKFANGNHDEERRPIDYALCDVSFGVNINKWPDGVDAGPFTKAIRHAFTTGDYAVMLSQVDEYATRHRLGCQLDPDYSDKEFGERWRPFTLQTRKKLREDLNALNYIWDYNDL